MGTINTSQLKNGTKVIFDKQPYVCQHVDFVKPGKGTAFYKLRVQNLISGNVLDKTLRTGEKVEEADVHEAQMEYLYCDGTDFVFMVTGTYEQLTVPAQILEDKRDLLLENTTCVVTLWNGQPIAVELPNQVAVEITYTEPAVKGDSQSRVMKEAQISTGGTISVPTFVDIGDRVVVDTRTRAYVSRENK